MSNIPWNEIDPGIASAVRALDFYGIETFESCQGGEGHSAEKPSIWFRGDDHAGLWAVWLLSSLKFKVEELSRHWNPDHGVPREPFWKVELSPGGMNPFSDLTS